MSSSDDRVTEAFGAMRDDSTAPGWSVNRGRPLWFGHPKGTHRQVMRLGGGDPDGGFLASILITTVSARWTRQRVNEHLDENALKRPGVRLLNLTAADMEALSRFLQVSLGHITPGAV
jgi:hypothetical protein